MSENFLESEIVSDQGVEHLQLKVDTAKLDAFQSTLKGAEVRGMNAFIGKLNALQDLEAKAQEIRAKQNGAIVIDRPAVAGVVIPVETANNEVTDHNEKIRALHRAVQEFNAARNEFLSTFIAKYIAPPVAQRNDPSPVRSEPRVGTRQPRLERQNSPQFTVSSGTPRGEAPEAMTEEQIIARMSDTEIDEAIKNFQIQGFQGLYREMAASNDKRATLLEMRRRLAANTDNSGVVNQALLAMARWLQEKSKK